jgi:hypothetical protein
MTDEAKNAEWVALVEYGAVYEAEVAAGRLESAGILSRIDRGGSVGIFGPGHAGATVHGVTLYVPADRLAEAREALDDAGDARP